MATKHSDEFKRDAAGMALTSGLPRKKLTGDLCIGLSSLNKWVRAGKDDAVPPCADQDLVRENDRLRRENRLLRQEREVF